MARLEVASSAWMRMCDELSDDQDRALVGDALMPAWLDLLELIASVRRHPGLR
jgi:hypothetical protein